MEYSIEHKTLHFRQPAGTSRGVYTTRDVWYVTLYDNSGKRGIGECAPLPDLSCDAYPVEEYEEYLHAACLMTCQGNKLPYDFLRDYPSILFGLEGAWRELHGLWQPLSAEEPICTINGLIWMGSYEEMQQRIEEKLQAGFRCVKLKIGAINFQDELKLLQRIRKQYSREQIELRVDANGGFSADEVEERLRQLAELDLHSIEQPIRQGHWEQMGRLCATSPLPIALDEELIGVNTRQEKQRLLDTIRPQYIVLKPSLHGGLIGCDEWIELAEERHISWWATSALESNVGLTHIARWTQSHHPPLPQGLGTGLLYTDNTEPHTIVRGDYLYYYNV